MSKERNRTVFLENPYDLEAVFESLRIASKEKKELLFLDRLLSTIRLNPDADIINVNYRLLHDLNLMKFEQIESDT
jgi:hypothetical protein